MSDDRAAWIEAIRADPENDGLRLICADWFEEQGTESDVARADFIRTQIARSQLPPDDPRQSPLEAQELRLLKRWAPDWCGIHPIFKKCRFRRGFIEFVHLHLQHFQHHRRAMFQLEPVRDVRLTGWDRGHDELVERVAKCEEWKHVETLRIHHQGIRSGWGFNLFHLLESAPLEKLRSLPTLLPMHEESNDLRRRLIALPVFRQLRELVIPNWYFTDWALPQVETWTNLRSLRFRESMTTHLQQLTRMPFWAQLEHLDLQGRCSEEEVEILADHLPPQVTELSLSQWPGPNAAPIRSDRLVQAIAGRPLESLSLTGRGFSSHLLPALLLAQTKWKLRRLKLHCNLSRFHLTQLAQSSSVTQLNKLDLSWSPDVNDKGAEALTSSEHLRSLTHLHLPGAAITTKGLQLIAYKSGWDRLRMLETSRIGCSESELSEILRGPCLQNLTWLKMVERKNQPHRFVLNRELAEALTRLPHLAGLQFEMNQCNSEAKQILARHQDRAWQWLLPGEAWSTEQVRKMHAPENCPPLDEAMSQLGNWQNR